MGPLRRDGFLLNAEPLGHVRSFPNSLVPFLPLCLARLSIGPANHNFYQSHLRVTIADNHEIARTPFVYADSRHLANLATRSATNRFAPFSCVRSI